MPPLDDHGQPIRPFAFNCLNNSGKAIDQLVGLSLGILTDGVINDAEANAFRQWVEKFHKEQPIWSFDELAERMQRIFEDGVVDEEERCELRQIMEELSGCTANAPASEGVECGSCALPLTKPVPEIVFERQEYIVTGKFAYGKRSEVEKAIISKGGIIGPATPRRSTDYLVIGTFASRDWAFVSYGRKIERAVQLRDEGSGIAIISEEALFCK